MQKNGGINTPNRSLTGSPLCPYCLYVQSGFIKPDGNLDERAHSFTNRLINVKGELNDLHQVWTNRVVAYNNTIQSGRSQLVRSAPRPVTGVSA